jgi:hypothetical protein
MLLLMGNVASQLRSAMPTCECSAFVSTNGLPHTSISRN